MLQRYSKLLTDNNLTGATTLLFSLAMLKFLIQMATNFTPGGYGIFRDELYYFDAGQHLSLGYVEFPAMVGILSAFINGLFGFSLIALHILPALAGAALVFFTGLICRQLGGGTFAQCLAALASLFAITFLAFGSLFTADAFDELWWVLATYILIRLINEDRPRLWLWFGLVTGLGLLTKLSIVAFGFAIIAGLLLTPQRKFLFNRWILFGGLIALSFLAPYLIWNATHGWPTLDFWSTYSSNHANPTDIPGFLIQQIITMNPLTFPLWLAGLYFFFFRSTGKKFRALGWAYLILYVLFTITRAKLYFLAPAYPVLFGAGALVFEQATSTRRVWLRPVYLSLMVALGIFLAPIAIPVLPPAGAATISKLVGIKVEDRATGILPQQLADRFSWDTMAATVAHTYHGLPPSQQARACIFAENYGEAGAIDFFGPRYGLPKAISGHNSYYLWGPNKCSGEVVITIGIARDEMQAAFSQVTIGDTITCTYCMPAENNLPIYIGYHLKQPISTFWPTIKNYS